MATAPNNDTEPKGFSGLSSLISDISKDIANANQCPNCGYVIEGCGQKCQKCGIIFAKYKASFAVTRTPPQTQQESSASNSSNITTSSVEKNDKTQDLKAWADSLIAEAKGHGEIGAKAEVEKKTSTRISPPADSGNKTRLKWLLGIGCVIAVLWFMSQPGNENITPRTSTPPKSTSTSSTAARPIEDKPQESPAAVTSDWLMREFERGVAEIENERARKKQKSPAAESPDRLMEELNAGIKEIEQSRANAGAKKIEQEETSR